MNNKEVIKNDCEERLPKMKKENWMSEQTVEITKKRKTQKNLTEESNK